MPIIAAASRSYDVARIAFPVRVRLTSTQDEGGADRDDPEQRHAHLSDVEALQVERAVVQVEGVVVARLRAEQQLHRVGKEERDA
jgi:hypothetical protein